MRDLFRSYYDPTETDLEKLWNEGLFIFDSNVLLNAYSYSDRVRDQFFFVLSRLQSRVWIPYQVALEYHRNRLRRINGMSGQRQALANSLKDSFESTFSALANASNEHRGVGVAGLELLIKEMQSIYQQISSAFAESEKSMGVLIDRDPVRQRFEALFATCIGPAPNDESEYRQLVEGGEARYKTRIPPGFADAEGKAKRGFIDHEIVYEEKFGDLILWRQILNHLRVAGVQGAVFVTSDRKDDWWDSNLRPHASLLSEGVDAIGNGEFWMYTAAQFLEAANKYLGTEVTAETIKEVKEVSESHALALSVKCSYAKLRADLIKAILTMRRVSFTYNDKRRIVEPQCYGMGHKGTELLRGHQLQGGAEREPLFDVSKIQSLEVLEEHFSNPAPNYRRTDSGMQIIFAQLELPMGEPKTERTD